MDCVARRRIPARLILCGLLLTACAPDLQRVVTVPQAPRCEELFDQGEELLDQRLPLQALERFHKAAALCPGDARVHHARAATLLRLGEPWEAALACAAADTAQPGDPPAPPCWQALLATAGQPAAVRAELDRLRQRPAPTPELLYSLYRGYRLLGERAVAASLLQLLARQTAPGFFGPEVARELFQLLLEAPPGPGRSTLAATYLSHFATLPEARHAARWLLAATPSRDPGQAVAHLLTHFPNTVPVLAAASAWLLDQQGDPRRAAALARRALDLLPPAAIPAAPPAPAAAARSPEHDRAQLRLTLGRALFATGNLDTAAGVLAQIAPPFPAYGSAAVVRARIAAARGRRREAAAHLHAAALDKHLGPVERSLWAELLAAEYGHRGEPEVFYRGSPDRWDPGTFEDITAAAGLAGVAAQRVAWGDCDGDGFADLALDGVVYRSQRGERFVLLSEPAPVPAGNGALWGDADDDGDLDLVITSPAGNRLWSNDGACGFTDSTARSPGFAAPRATEAAAWGDADGDGDLDLYLANYETGARRGQCAPDQLWIQREPGRFREATGAFGLVREEPLCGRGVTWVDADGDGLQDILVANYRLQPNLAWRSDGAGFRDAARTWGLQGRSQGGAFGHTLSLTPGDFDGDLHLDLFVSNLAHPRFLDFSDPAALLLGPGPGGGRFVDTTVGSGIAFEETSADAAAADVDLDGDLDLYITSVYRGRFSHLYLNDGAGHFQDASWLSGTRVENSWGAAFADADRDGDPDLLVASPDGVRLLRNRTTGRRWLRLTVDDPQCNRHGVGARLRIACGNSRQDQWLVAGRGSGNQDALAWSAGLGDCTGPVTVTVQDACGVTWTAHTPPDREVVLTPPPALALSEGPPAGR